MSSTYSTTLRIQLIDTNTELEAWGVPTDNNLGTIIEQAITGVQAVSLTNLTSYSLTASNAVVDQSRNAVLLLTGNLNANCNVIAPSVQKVYVISNQTTNNKSITIKTSGGNGVQIANGTNQLVYCNGTTFFSAVNINTILGNLAVSGNVSIAGTKITLGTSVISQNTSNLTFNAPTSNIVSFQPTTGGFTPPSGTVAQRPASPVNGMSRWNTEYGWYEIWNGTIWQQITGSFVVNYLIVAGGGSAGSGTSWAGISGSGAGGLITNVIIVAPMTSFPVVVGAGGAGATLGVYAPVNGSNSSVFGYTAIGGGAAATNSAGGSGGGGGYLTGGYGTFGQGNNGGYGIADPEDLYGAGSGGGAGAAGTGRDNQAGGIGLVSSITGTATYYAGGGGSSSNTDSTGGAGGLGGGGAGGSSYSRAGGSGAANTGGGAGGINADSQSTYPYPSVTASGGSGVVIISYASTFARATGGTITTYSSGGSTYYVHKFTSSGTFATI